MRKTVLLPAALGVLLLVSACGGQQEASTASSGQPAKTETGATAQAPTTQQPAKTEPAKTETPKTEPAKTEPAKTEPAKTEPAKTEAPKTGTPTTEAPKPAATPAPPANTPSPNTGASTAPAQPAAQSEPAKTAPAAEAPKTEPKAEPTASTASVKAEELYKTSCMSCHGGNLEGKPGPNLQKVGASKTKDQIMTQISKGGSRMPGFENKIEAADIETLAVWLADKK